MGLSGIEWFFVIMVSVLLLISVVCNILVITVVAVTPKLRNPTNILICNLAISDLLLASLILPQNLHDISHSDVNYSKGDFLCRTVYTCPLLCIMSSIYSMAAVSIGRSQAIVLNTDRKLTFRGALVELIIIWLISFIFCIPTLYEHSQFTAGKNKDGTVILGCGSNGVSFAFTVINGVTLTFVAYVIPLGILLYNYGKILLYFRSKGVFGKQAAERGEVFQAMFKSRMTVVKMLILVAVIFAVSWAPYFALLLIEKVSGISDTEHSDEAANMLKIALSAFSTAYNFFVYVAYNRSFRLAVVRLLHRPALVHSGCRPVRITPSGDDRSMMTQTDRHSPPTR